MEKPLAKRMTRGNAEYPQKHRHPYITHFSEQPKTLRSTTPRVRGRSSQFLKVNSPLRRGGGGSGSGVCGLLGVDEIVDGSDLDLFSWARRAEREDEDGFVGERIAARAFAEHLRLNKTYAMHKGRKSISNSVSAQGTTIRAPQTAARRT
jgi:hypothetical protein